MKRFLFLVAATVVGALTVVGCGDDGPSEPINVYLQFKVGDQFTYHYYTRDAANQKVASSKQVRKWAVVSVNAPVPGRTDVTQIEEIVFDSLGTTEQFRDTLFFSSTGQGKVEQYDIIGNLVSLISFAAPYRDSIDPVWVQIGDVKTVGALTWASFPGTIFVPNVQIPVGSTIVTANISMQMNAAHTGRVAITTPAGSLTNNFHTNHTLKFDVTSLGITVIADSIHAHYDIDTKGGIVKHTADSKTLTVGTSTVDIPGYEMELVSYTRVP